MSIYLPGGASNLTEITNVTVRRNHINDKISVDINEQVKLYPVIKHLQDLKELFKPTQSI